MFSLTISDHIMIAHSMRGADLQPMLGVHGNTLVIEVEFRRTTLDASNFLLDMGLARTELRRILDVFDYQNLDEHPDLLGQNTTMEFMAQLIHGRLAEACRAGRIGEAARTLAGIRVQVRESPRAWAAFDGPISAG